MIMKIILYLIGVVRKKIIPTIYKLYLEMHHQVMEEVKTVCEKKKIGATITLDGAMQAGIIIPTMQWWTL